MLWSTSCWSDGRLCRRGTGGTQRRSAARDGGCPELSTKVGILSASETAILPSRCRHGMAAFSLGRCNACVPSSPCVLSVILTTDTPFHLRRHSLEFSVSISDQGCTWGAKRLPELLPAHFVNAARPRATSQTPRTSRLPGLSVLGAVPLGPPTVRHFHITRGGFSRSLWAILRVG
jgi:hypothetical protein